MRRVEFEYLGKQVGIHLHDNEYLSNQIAKKGKFYELNILESIRRNWPKQKTIVDVGANIGNHSVFFENFLECERILSFEPLPMNYELLIKNIGPKVTAHQLALGEKEKKVSMYFNSGNMGHVKIDDSQSGPVEVRTLDSFELQDVTLLKLDVESYEPNVIKGAFDTIKRCTPVIFAEGNPDKIFPLLMPYGYVMAALWAGDSRDMCFVKMLPGVV